MPCGLVRTDLNTTGINYLHGFRINLLTHIFGNTVNWVVRPSHFGNPVLLPMTFGNVVNWIVEPDETMGYLHFGNYLGGEIPPPNIIVSTYSGIELEDGSGLIVLEDGSIILLEVQ